MNTGSWTFDGWFVGPTARESVYWPGGCLLVEDEGPPQVRRLLDDRTRAQITPPRTAASARDGRPTGIGPDAAVTAVSGGADG